MLACRLEQGLIK